MSFIFQVDEASNESPISGDSAGLSQDGCVTQDQDGCVTQDQEQTLGSELGLMEMTDSDCSHLQHLIHAHREGDARPHPATAFLKDTTGSTVIYPLISAQVIDLSASSDGHCLVMSGEKTPVPYGEVPGFVLAKIKDEESVSETHDKTTNSYRHHSRVSARVCLEKRFESMCAEIPPQDIHSAVLSNFLTALQHRTEAQEVAVHPQKQWWMKNEQANAFDLSSSHVGDSFDRVSNICSQVLAHMVEPTKPQTLIIPKSFSFNFPSESPLEHADSSNIRKELVKMKKSLTTPVETSVSLKQRRERHNSKERERRKRIRLYCDELNTMVPFCNSETDKATTLQWTTAYLAYINKTYGDTFKEEFQRVFACGKEDSLKSNFPRQHRISDDTEATLSIPLASEQ